MFTFFLGQLTILVFGFYGVEHQVFGEMLQKMLTFFLGPLTLVIIGFLLYMKGDLQIKFNQEMDWLSRIFEGANREGRYKLNFDEEVIFFHFYDYIIIISVLNIILLVGIGYKIE
ncbi:hypothetical protein Hanom_Chr11g00976511 [Helianthus anomalus]